jgi:hypothetical protein
MKIYCTLKEYRALSYLIIIIYYYIINLSVARRRSAAVSSFTFMLGLEIPKIHQEPHNFGQ